MELERLSALRSRDERGTTGAHDPSCVSARVRSSLRLLHRVAAGRNDGHRLCSHRLHRGDWYDIISLGGGDIALVIGDAVGHGAEAAPAMVKLRGALQGFAGTNGRSPATVVGQKAGRCPPLALDGIRQLRRATANGPRDIDELRDQVLRALGQDTVQQDDIALLAVRIHLPPEE